MGSASSSYQAEKKSHLCESGNLVTAFIFGNSRNKIVGFSGFASNHLNFDALIPHLTESFELILLDNPGMGESINNKNELDFNLMCQDLHEALASWGYDLYHLVGISMGGIVAQIYTLMFGSEVQTLALLCTLSGGARRVDLPHINEHDLVKLYSMPAELTADSVVKKIVHPDFYIAHPEQVNRICNIRIAYPPDPTQVILQHRAVIKTLKDEIKLEDISCPTWVATGSNDRFVDKINSDILCQRIPNSHYMEFEKTDHLFFFEKPVEVSKKLTEFIQEHT